MLHGESLPRCLLRQSDNFQGTQRIGATQSDDGVLGLRIVYRRHGELRDVLEGHPADPVFSGAVHLGLAVSHIEPERGTEPHLDEKRGLEDRVGHSTTPQALFYGPLRGLQRELEVDRRKGYEDEVPDLGGAAGPMGGGGPCRSTVSIESPSCRETVDDAVEITALAPRHAAVSDSLSFRSPRTSSAPRLFRRVAVSGLAVARTSALTGLRRSPSRRQISPPSMPVAPTTRFILPSLTCSF